MNDTYKQTRDSISFKMEEARNEETKSIEDARRREQEEEMDTKEIENLTPTEMYTLLYAPAPAGTSTTGSDMTQQPSPYLQMPLHYDRFALAYSKYCFQGWVKQPSPSCAAAVVATTWNCLNKLHRNAPEAKSTMDILKLFEDMLERRVMQAQKSIERTLGQELSEFDAAFEKELRQQLGKTLGGKGDAAVKKKDIFQICSYLLTDERATREYSSLVFQEFRTLVAGTEPRRSTAVIDQDQVILALAGGHENHGVVTLSDEDGGNTGTNIVMKEELTVENRDDLEEPLVGPAWNWKDAFYKYIHNRDGLAKLRRPKPSTAIIGNAEVMRVAQELTESLSSTTSISLRGSTLMAKQTASGKIQIPLTCRDTTAQERVQWTELWGAFMQPDVGLIYHLKNHYAMIFAMRQYVDDEDQQEHREILTTRRGQRPNTWIPWHEVRETLLGWAGYKIMIIKAKHI